MGGKYPLSWTNQPIKILGIFIHTNMEYMHELNYPPLLQKVQEIITMWRYRSLSLLDKFQIINSLLASQFVYRLMVLPSPPERILKEYKT